MEKAILVGIKLPGQKLSDVENSLAELARLAETAGAAPAEILIQRKTAVDPGYYIGSGKARELAETAEEQGIGTIIFDDDLRPGQQKNLENETGAKIIDRTRLILDIFAQRARSKEGILQVERAQLEYYLPRLSNRGIMLDNQAGGIGTRGPGERKLEVDQRRIRDRIAYLDREIIKISEQRSVLRKKRSGSGIPVAAIVGYTNAGKSTLLNRISCSGQVYADDKLFATLDPTTRKVILPGGSQALFTDTVGFINKLPHALVASFRATLEETLGADCLVHVCDASDQERDEHSATVLKVLAETGAGGIPVITVMNKADLIGPEEAARLKKEGWLLVSAKSGEGIKDLLRIVERTARPGAARHRITVPFARSSAMDRIRELAAVKKRRFTEKGAVLELETTETNWRIIKELARCK